MYCVIGAAYKWRCNVEINDIIGRVAIPSWAARHAPHYQTRSLAVVIGSPS